MCNRNLKQRARRVQEVPQLIAMAQFQNWYVVHELHVDLFLPMRRVLTFLSPFYSFGRYEFGASAAITNRKNASQVELTLASSQKRITAGYEKFPYTIVKYKRG